MRRAEKGGVRWFAPGDWVQVEHPWVWPESLGGYGHGHGHHDHELRAKRIASAEKVMAVLFPPASAGGPESAAEPARPRARLVNPSRTSVIGF